MSTESVDHSSNAMNHLGKGLNSIKNGNISDAIESFFHAAVEFEKAQDFRQIPALWEAIGKLSEMQGDSAQHVTEKWPLDYHVMETDEWHKQKDKMHKLAWVYQWAAEHRERAGDPHMAYPLFFKSAKKAEQTQHSKNGPNWPAKLYHKAALNFIRTYGTIKYAPPDAQHIQKEASDKELIEDGIKTMEMHYLKNNDRSKAYGTIAIAYRLLKSALIEHGNLLEAERFRTKERSALMHYYFQNKRFHRGIAEWLAGGGFWYFILLIFFMVFLGFPYIYYSYNLIISPQGYPTWFDAFLYSLETALIMGHDNFSAVGISGSLLTIIETALSFFGLGVFVWWVTKRLE